jgi:hypothetical protein
MFGFHHATFSLLFSIRIRCTVWVFSRLARLVQSDRAVRMWADVHHLIAQSDSAFRACGVFPAPLMNSLDGFLGLFPILPRPAIALYE